MEEVEEDAGVVVDSATVNECDCFGGGVDDGGEVFVVDDVVVGWGVIEFEVLFEDAFKGWEEVEVVKDFLFFGPDDVNTGTPLVVGDG